MYTKAQLRALRAPKGGNPFSAPQLFAKSRPRRPRAKQTRASVNRRIDAPVATTSVIRGNSGPTNRTMALTRREFIGDINGSVAFANTQYSLNPALVATFPWGGQIASSFEEYDTVSVSFCYEPESSSTATGAIIISFDYDALDAAPGTKQAALEMADSIRAAPWVPCKLVLKPTDLRKRGTLFTRTGTVASSDLKTYDLGNLNISTVGQSGTTIIGELWIEYQFILRTPQLASSSSTPSSVFAKVVGTTSVAPTTPFGSAAVITGSGVTASGNTLTFTSAGTYLVMLTIAGLAAGTLGLVTTGSTGTVTQVDFFSGPTVNASTQATVGHFVTTSSANQTLVIAYTGAPMSTLTACSARVSSWSLA